MNISKYLYSDILNKTSMGSALPKPLKTTIFANLSNALA